MIKLSFSITLIFLGLLAINSIYAQNPTANLENTNNTTLLSYKFEPFLLLNGTIFKDVPHDDTLSLANFAIAAWIRTNETTLKEHAHIVNKGGFSSDEVGENMNYGFWLTKNGTIQGGFETRAGNNHQVSSPGKYNDGNWHYVLLSYGNSLLRLDIDGKQIATKNTNAKPDNTGDQPLRIGANSINATHFYNGSIDEVRVWNRGLTDSEIAQIYNSGTFNTDGQVLYLEVPKLFLMG
jgi:hypothetical protein